MGALERLASRQHLAVASLGVFLFATSPWISMLRRVPRDASALDHAHVVLGFALLVLAVTYTWSCTRTGRWRLYWPWLAGNSGATLRDFAGLLRGRLPGAEPGGLFSTLQGLLLVALLATGLTGAAWYVEQGTAAALDWRVAHQYAARTLLLLLVLHVLAVASHLLDFLRD